MKALVVDDSAVMRKVMVGALARAGIEDVAQAADGKEAVDAVMAQEFHLVLLDWNMPNMLGIDALRAIRAAGEGEREDGAHPDRAFHRQLASHSPLSARSLSTTVISGCSLRNMAVLAGCLSMATMWVNPSRFRRTMRFCPTRPAPPVMMIL